MARPKGATNKFNDEARKQVLLVFQLMGGTEAFLAWAKENPTLFYLEFWKRLIPREIAADSQFSGLPIMLNSVHVANPEDALNVLERMHAAQDATPNTLELQAAPVDESPVTESPVTEEIL